MNTQRPQAQNIAEIIKVMQGGIDFYQEAQKEVDTDYVQSAFQRMIREKKKAIEDLQPFAINEQGEPEDDSHWMVDLRKHYTKLIGTFSSEEEHTYVKQLEEVEDKVLEVLDDALGKTQPTECMEVLRRIRAAAQQLHDEMKALQQATA
ncbi:PA2169 family four-helix-bundle protein [Glaciecola sp. 1036]|uniref:PA2169 family four-helix-bundle protein n=1 Tax=Alteromonadaceae TaxID=72275 RepID=UPI003CFCA735